MKPDLKNHLLNISKKDLKQVKVSRQGFKVTTKSCKAFPVSRLQRLHQNSAFKTLQKFQRLLFKGIQIKYNLKASAAPLGGMFNINPYLSMKHIIERYLAAMPSESYILQLWHVQEDRYRPLRKVLPGSGILRHLGFLKARNVEGYNIYCRPNSWQYVLLDDLARPALEALAKERPCLLMETSPGNYQAFLHLPIMPNSYGQAIEICRAAAASFGADMQAAQPLQVARLPFFTNRKAKHRRPDGSYPQVVLHGATNRFTTYSPPKGAADALTGSGQPQGQQLTKPRQKNHSRSEFDFWLVCDSIRKGLTLEETRQRLLAKSEKFNEMAEKRKQRYFDFTYRQAEKAVRERLR